MPNLKGNRDRFLCRSLGELDAEDQVSVTICVMIESV